MTGKIIKHGLQGIVLVLLVLAACYVSMGRIFIANIDQYRLEIENRLSKIVKMPVKIDKLSGNFRYLDPILAIHGLSIGDAEPAIHSDFIRVHLDVIQSLRQGAFVIEDIDVSGLQLDLIQDDQGGWRVEGLPKPKQRFEMNLLWEFLAQVGGISLAEVNVGVIPHSEDLTGTHSRSYRLRSDKRQAFKLVRQDDVTRLSMVLQWVVDGASATEEFKLAGQYDGDPRRADFSALLYLKIPQFDLASFLPASITRNKLDTVSIDGQYWLEADQGEVLLRGWSKVHELRLKSDEQSKLISSDINIELGMRHVYGEGTSIHVNSISGSWMGENFEIQGASAAVNPSANGRYQLVLQLPDLSLKALSPILVKTGKQIAAIDVATADNLNGLAIEGVIVQPKLYVELGQNTPYFELMSEVEGLHLHSSAGIPAISRLDGFLALRPGAGYFDVHTEQPFSIEYDALFPAPWLFSRGSFRTHFSQSDSGIHIVSELAEFSYGELEARLKFTVNLAREVTRRTWGLEIGIKNADIVDAYRYLPYVMSADLRDWLQQSIHSGTAVEGGLVFHGPLGKKTPKDQKVFEIYFKVDDATFDYDPSWPRLEDVAATLYIGNKEVYTDDATGRMFDSKILSAEVTVPITASGVDTLLINGRVKGGFSDGLKILTQTPLNSATNKTFEGWQGGGEMEGSLQLNIPLGRRAAEAPWADVKVSLSDVDVFMPQYDLSVQQLVGSFRYETIHGIASPKFKARLFDKPVTGRVNTEGESDGGAINVLVDGRVDIADLEQWSGQTLLSQLEGVMSYTARLHIPQGSRSFEPIFVEAHSNLDEVNIRLPQPMKKAPEELKDLSYHHAFMDYGHKIDLKLDDQVEASIKVVDGLLMGGRVHFGTSAMGAITYDKLRVSGEIENLVYTEWDDLMTALAEESEVSIEGELVSKLASINLRADLLDVMGATLEDAELEITRSNTAWNIKIHNEMLGGLVLVDDDDTKPIDINLNYLHLVSDPSSEADPLGDLDPAEVVAFKLNIDSVLLDEDDYGQWVFEFVPNEFGGLLDIESALVKGLDISTGAKVTWRYQDGVHNCVFDGRILVADVADSLEQWGFASSIQGQEFDFLANLAWDGSPAMVDMLKVKGLIELREGRGTLVQAEADLTTLKLIGIFDFSSLMRRFRLDFSDVVDEGFKFDDMRGSIRLNQGIVDVVDPIQIEGSGSKFKLGGRINLIDETLDNDMIVTLPVNRNLPWYAAYSAYVAGPLTGAAVIIVQKIFQNQIDAISSAKYKITGTIDEPHVEFVSIFNASVREAPEDEASVELVE